MSDFYEVFLDICSFVLDINRNFQEAILVGRGYSSAETWHKVPVEFSSNRRYYSRISRSLVDFSTYTSPIR